MEIITQDQPGVLYRLSSALANSGGCNIEVALIDTEGPAGRGCLIFNLTRREVRAL